MFTWVRSVRSEGSAFSTRVMVMYQYLVPGISYWTGASINLNCSCSTPDRSYIRRNSPRWLPILGSCWLPIKLLCTHCPTPQAHNHVELKQSSSISMADVGGSNSSRSARADDTASGQARRFLCWSGGIFASRVARKGITLNCLVACVAWMTGTFAFKLEEQKCEVTMPFDSGTTVHRGKLWLCKWKDNDLRRVLTFLFSAAYSRASSLQDAYYLRSSPLSICHNTSPPYILLRPTGTWVRLISSSRQIYRRGELHHEELPHMYVLPCVSCIKLAFAHTFYVCPRASCMI